MHRQSPFASFFSLASNPLPLQAPPNPPNPNPRTPLFVRMLSCHGVFFPPCSQVMIQEHDLPYVRALQASMDADEPASLEEFAERALEPVMPTNVRRRCLLSSRAGAVELGGGRREGGI